MNSNIENFNYYSGTFKPSFIQNWTIFLLFNITYYVLHVFFIIIVITKRNNDFVLRSLFRYIKSIHTYLSHNQYNTISILRQPFLSIIQPPSKNIEIMNVSHLDSFSVWINMKKYSPTNTCIMYIHGGGYVSGDIAGYFGLVEKISDMYSCPVLLPQYRLSPEVLIETSVNDLYEAYTTINTEFTNIVIMGDSAGGGLAVLLSKRLRDKQELNHISSLVLFSPMLNLECNTNSYIYNDDPMMSSDIVKQCAYFALGGKNPSEINNPIMGFFNDFPPTFISVADDELFYDDAITLTEKFEHNKGMYELHVYKNTIHSFPVLYKYSKCAVDVFDKLTIFIRKHLR